MSSLFSLKDEDGACLEIEYYDDGDALLTVDEKFSHGAQFGSVSLNTEQRRDLLDHLLQAEGLPGVEEIERAVCEEEAMRLRADRDIAVDRYQELHDALLVHLGINYDPDYGYNVECDTEEQVYPSLRDAIGAVVMIDNAEKNELRRELEEARAETERERVWFQENIHQAATDLRETRQTRLHELLEAEARERVEVVRFDGQSFRSWETKVGIYVGGYDEGELYATIDGAGNIDLEHDACYDDERVWNAILCLAAALAEKRRREQDDSIPLEEMVDRLGIREEFESAKRESEVSE